MYEVWSVTISISDMYTNGKCYWGVTIDVECSLLTSLCVIPGLNFTVDTVRSLSPFGPNSRRGKWSYSKAETRVHYYCVWTVVLQE